MQHVQGQINGQPVQVVPGLTHPTQINARPIANQSVAQRTTIQNTNTEQSQQINLPTQQTTQLNVSSQNPGRVIPQMNWSIPQINIPADQIQTTPQMNASDQMMNVNDSQMNPQIMQPTDRNVSVQRNNRLLNIQLQQQHSATMVHNSNLQLPHQIWFTRHPAAVVMNTQGSMQQPPFTQSRQDLIMNLMQDQLLPKQQSGIRPYPQLVQMPNHQVSIWQQNMHSNVNGYQRIIYQNQNQLPQQQPQNPQNNPRNGNVNASGNIKKKF